MGTCKNIGSRGQSNGDHPMSLQMSLQRAISPSILCPLLLLAEMASLDSFASAQDLSKTVVPITQLKWIGPGAEAKFATGFCLSEDCRFVGTNYHVAMMMQVRKIKGDRIIHRYLATGPDDDGATINDASWTQPVKYTLGRDIAVYELRYPLAHYHGFPFSLRDLQLGQQVDIYAYPKESISPVRSLLKFHGAFKGETTGGLLAFDYSLSNGKGVRPGASGGLVVDSRSQQVVGILSGVARDGEPVAMAVPIESLANFVSKVEPWLSQSLFPSANKETISPASADIYQRFVPRPVVDSPQSRNDEAPNITDLRKSAQRQADGMRNLVAVQSFAWGSGDKAPSAFAEYEVKILEGFQRFREYPDGKKDLQNVPFPPLNTVVVPGGEWSELPQMLGTSRQVKIRQASDHFVEGRRVKVFQYQAESEDGVCVFKSVRERFIFSSSNIIGVPCYGEVWTDERLNILRVSEHLELAGEWKAYESVVTYGRLQRPGGADRIIPITIFTQIRNGKKVYWCRGFFINYRIFDAQAKIVASDSAQSLLH